jgi:hypothetical protein
MRVEDYVSPTNTVRAIDAYVGTLNLTALGYKHSQFVSATGQPVATMCKSLWTASTS